MKPASYEPSSNLNIVGRPSPSVWNVKHYKTVPVVGPDGTFDWHHFSIDKTLDGKLNRQERGDSPLRFEGGEVVLSAWGRKKGYTLYHDICFGSALSVVGGRPRSMHELHPDVDGEVYWRMWLAFCKMQRQNKPIRPGAPVLSGVTVIMDKFGEDFYHPEIKRRRIDHLNGGGQAVDASDAIAMLKSDAGGDDPVDDGLPDTMEGLSALARKTRRSARPARPRVDAAEAEQG
jgi:hypothetical protein